MNRDQLPPRHALSLLAAASSVRLDDPRLDQERVVLLGAALSAGREAVRALDAWLAQSLVEYRGSRSAWNLEATTARLCRVLDEYETTIRDAAARLGALIPSIGEGDQAAPLADGRRPGTRVLHEVDAASRLLLAIRSAAAPGSRDDGHRREQRADRRSVA